MRSESSLRYIVSLSYTKKVGSLTQLGQVEFIVSLSLLFMPTLSVYPVSVTVGGQGSAVIDWKKISTLVNVLQKIITNFKYIYIYVAVQGRN